MIDISVILQTHSLRDFLPDGHSLRDIGNDRWRGRCPLCNSSNGLSVFRHEKGHDCFNCFSCGERGSVIDLYAKLNCITLRRAIVDLAPTENSPHISIETRLRKGADDYFASRGKYTLCCVRCPATRQVADDLSAAILMDGGSNWEVAPDGIAAICPKCLSYGRAETAYTPSNVPGCRTRAVHPSQLLPMSQGALANL